MVRHPRCAASAAGRGTWRQGPAWSWLNPRGSGALPRSPSSRSEFWWPWGAAVVVNMAINLLLGADSTAGSIIGGIFALAILVPSLAVGARRLHDTGRSGWWQLLWLLPCIGWIALIVFWVLPEKAEGDKYNVA
ncbi:DUF805 domain-containing protein [Nocardioides sp. NPDC058538]|uniref:DUF805 domain-containing protein n=1 Tax=Nocardioides sp. NPDC058538 TaxID=3346542 RepID=UPI0036682F4D